MTIETPVKPASTPLPPPDPALRQAVPAPPPSVAERHARVCMHCGSPLHPDQLACLSCGRMAEDATGRVRWRTWGLASAAALLLVGGTVGAAVAGLPHGKHVPKPQLSAVPPKKAIPPATAGTGSTPGGSATTPLPDTGSTGTTPPALHTPKTHSPSTSHSSTGSSPSHNSSGGSSSGSGGGGSPASPKKKKKAHHSTKPGASSTLFASGVAPEDGELFDPDGDSKDNPGDVINTYDNDSSTAWSTKKDPLAGGKSGVGIRVKAPSSESFKAIGILDRTPGFDVEVRYASGSPPPQLNGWTLAGKASGASSKQSISLQKGAPRKADWYLVWITKVPSGSKRVTLSEIQLLQ